jgi:N-acetylmuramic acid 6-phosphate etherase
MLIKKKSPSSSLNLDDLLTEQRNLASMDIDQKSTVDILRIINREDRMVAKAVEKQIPRIARVVEWITQSFQKQGRLIYVGSGTSGRLGILDASECPPTYNVPPDFVIGVIAGGNKAIAESVEGAEDDEYAGRLAMRRLRISEKDIIVGIAASGRTPYVVGAMKFSKEKKAKVVSLTSTPDSPMEKLADEAITPLTGPEVVTGSTRMKAGTAQKMVLNMLTTAAMIRMGYVYGNLMIHVQPTNDKLRERSRRIVMEAAGKTYEEADQALRSAKGNIKVSILMLHFQETTGQARLRLKKAGQNLRKAMTSE